MPIIRSYNCSSSLWVYRCNVVVAMLSPSSDGKPEAATAVIVAPDDGQFYITYEQLNLCEAETSTQ
jgi:hypothetical protein